MRSYSKVYTFLSYFFIFSSFFKGMGIPVVLDSPGVGKNLQDHVAVGGSGFLVDKKNETSSGPSFVLPRSISMQTFMEFLQKDSGPLYSMPACEVMGFLNTK